jgi:hypothetical protein
MRFRREQHGAGPADLGGIELDEGAAAADLSGAEFGEGGAEERGIQEGIAIEKEEPRMARAPCGGVARFGDLVVRLEDDLRAVLGGDLRGAVGRVVIADDDFVGRRLGDSCEALVD